MSKSPIDTFSLACPKGGDFYICQGNSTQFIGCCNSDPCADGAGTCPSSDLEPATFNKLDYQGILAQDCSGSADADWYTCSALATPFMGCCTTNACTNTAGCPTNDLVAAELSGNATQARFFLTTTASASSTTATTKSASSSTGSSSSSTTAAATTTEAAASSTAAPGSGAAASGLSTGAKAGLGIGAVALLALVGLLFFLIRRAMLKRRGVVVRGSYPPSTPSMICYSPARTTYAGKSSSDTHAHPFCAHKDVNTGLSDPNQITNTPPTITAPVRPSLPHGPSSFKTYSAGSSPSTGLLSRESSLKSTTASSNVLGIRSGSPAPAFQPYRGVSPQPHAGYSSPSMAYVAELDGSEAFPSPPVSEMAADTPVSTQRPSMSYRPYRPER